MFFICTEDLRSAEPSTVSNVIDEKRQQPKQRHAEDSSMECNATTHDGHWFLRELNQCKVGIQAHVDRYESVLASTEDIIPEEVVGKIRATIGKANLLMNKKLNQFNQLCLDSIVSCSCTCKAVHFHSFSLSLCRLNVKIKSLK